MSKTRPQDPGKSGARHSKPTEYRLVLCLAPDSGHTVAVPAIDGPRPPFEDKACSREGLIEIDGIRVVEADMVADIQRAAWPKEPVELTEGKCQHVPTQFFQNLNGTDHVVPAVWKAFYPPGGNVINGTGHEAGLPAVGVVEAVVEFKSQTAKIVPLTEIEGRRCIHRRISNGSVFCGQKIGHASVPGAEVEKPRHPVARGRGESTLKDEILCVIPPDVFEVEPVSRDAERLKRGFVPLGAQGYESVEFGARGEGAIVERVDPAKKSPQMRWSLVAVKVHVAETPGFPLPLKMKPRLRRPRVRTVRISVVAGELKERVNIACGSIHGSAPLIVS